MSAALGAFFMFTVMNVFAKLLSAHHSVVEIAFYRNLIACMPFLILVFGFGRRDILVIRSQPKLVGVRALIGSLSLVTTFTAFSLMPMADTTALLFASTLFVPVLGVFFLKEKVGPYRWAAVFIGFTGVVIMVRPTGDVYALGIAVAMIAALMHATLQIILRYLGRYEQPETVAFYFVVIGALLTALPMPFVAVRPALAEVPLLFGVGLSGAAAQWLLSLAFRHAPAATVTVFNYSGIVWATLFDWLVFGAIADGWTFIGAAIIVSATSFIARRESAARARRAT